MKEPSSNDHPTGGFQSHPNSGPSAPLFAERVVAVSRGASRHERLRLLVQTAWDRHPAPALVVAWVEPSGCGTLEGAWQSRAEACGTFSLQVDARGDASRLASAAQVATSPDFVAASRLSLVLERLEGRSAVPAVSPEAVLYGLARSNGRSVGVVVLPSPTGLRPRTITSAERAAAPDAVPGREGADTGLSRAALERGPCVHSEMCASRGTTRWEACEPLQLLAEIALAAEESGTSGSASAGPFPDWFPAEDFPEGTLPLPPAAAMEALAEFAAGAGHEINNPVANIVGRAERLLREEEDPRKRRLLAAIVSQALRIRDMIGDLMLFGRPPELRRQRVSLLDEARTAVERLRAEPFASQTVFVIDTAAAILPPVECVEDGAECGDATKPADAIVASDRAVASDDSAAEGDAECPRPVDPSVVWADATQVRVVLYELLRNACEASGAGRVEVRVVPRAETVETAVYTPRVTIAADQWRRMFFPFYSGRQAGRGLGFGLCKVWRIVDRHGGSIDVVTESDGTTFSVRWPRTQPCRR
ncbi:MAG: sensor histidine kinase [Planctomycetota bacterium]|nr:MAG: sensor histidine kinase [Planctomycetota bacterium]